jgi:hypothetical protein
VRRRGPSCLCSSWPIGGSPRPRSSGISTSWPHAISEALELQLEIHRCCHPKWFVPGDGVAALGVELVVMLRWRRASRIRLLFIFSFRGPFCKSAGPGCVIFSFVDLLVICNPTADI